MGSGSAPILVMGQQVDQIVDATNSLTDRLAIGRPIARSDRRTPAVARGRARYASGRSCPRSVSRMTDGDLNERVESPHTGDELERLVTTMNGMLERILSISVERERRFVSDASHELRSPIASARAVLESDAMPSPQTQGALRELQRLEDLANQLTRP